MAEEKETKKTTTKKTTTKSAPKSSTTKSTSKTTTKKATTKAKSPSTSKLSSTEREKKEALRREVLEHYNRKQSLRPTPVVSEGPEMHNDAIESEESLLTTNERNENLDREEAIKAEDNIGIEVIPPTNSVTENRTTPTTSPLGTNLYAQTPPETNLKRRDPNRGRNFRKAMIYLFTTKDGLFYVAGFIALIAVIILMVM